jgi:tetratricopeptide (TPR) repeat protein
MEGSALGGLADLLAQTGRAGEAVQLFREALVMLEEIGEARFCHVHRCHYALCLLALGRKDEARQAWAEAWPKLHELGAVHDITRLTPRMRQACGNAGIPPLDEARNPPLDEPADSPSPQASRGV